MGNENPAKVKFNIYAHLYVVGSSMSRANASFSRPACNQKKYMIIVKYVFFSKLWIRNEYPLLSILDLDLNLTNEQHIQKSIIIIFFKFDQS